MTSNSPFRTPYLQAMRESAPRMFNELRRSGQMDQHVEQKVREAHELLVELMGKNSDPQSRRTAEEQVIAQMTEFPTSRETNPRRSPGTPTDLTSSR